MLFCRLLTLVLLDTVKVALLEKRAVVGLETGPVGLETGPVGLDTGPGVVETESKRLDTGPRQLESVLEGVDNLGPRPGAAVFGIMLCRERL